MKGRCGCSFFLFAEVIKKKNLLVLSFTTEVIFRALRKILDSLNITPSGLML